MDLDHYFQSDQHIRPDPPPHTNAISSLQFILSFLTTHSVPELKKHLCPDMYCPAMAMTRAVTRGAADSQLSLSLSRQVRKDYGPER